jgi:predicted ABC-type exoprotein transport system permease subunit
MNPKALFRQRTQKAWIHAIRIIRMLSSSAGFPLLIGACLILFYLAYQQLLHILPASFPVPIALSLLYAFVLTSRSHRTWLQAADTVFLLPMENEMKAYFQASLRYNAIVQWLRWSLLFSIAWPLFRLRIGSFALYVLIWLLLSLMLYWNIRVLWLLLHRRASLTRWQWYGWYLLRYLLNFVLITALCRQMWSGLFLVSLIAGFILWRLLQTTPAWPYPWYGLLAMEQRLQRRYQRIANWFVDLPGAGRTILPRKWWTRLLRFCQRRPTVESYLYWRSFLRDQDMFPLYLRMQLFFGVLLWFLRYPLLQGGAILLSLLLTAIQLPDLAKSSRYPYWLRLYPYASAKALPELMAILLSIQAVILNLLFLIYTANFTLPLTTLVMSLILAWVYSYLLYPLYQRRKEQSPSK